jgi:hypothetical protein
MLFELVTHSTNMIERNRIMKEYMEEEGERELTGRCMFGRKQHDRVVIEAGSSRSGHGRQRPRVREVVDNRSTLGRRPPGLPP